MNWGQCHIYFKTQENIDFTCHELLTEKVQGNYSDNNDNLLFIGLRRQKSLVFVALSDLSSQADIPFASTV